MSWVLAAEQRGHGVFGRLTDKIRKLMRKGRSAEGAKLQLMRELGVVQGAPKQENVPINGKPEVFADQLLQLIFEVDSNPQPAEPLPKNIRTASLKTRAKEILFIDSLEPVFERSGLVCCKNTTKIEP